MAAPEETTRSIKIGLYVPDSDSMRNIVDSHDFFSYCVSYYTDLLLDMRGEDVWIRNPETLESEKIQASVFHENLIRRMKEAAKRNGNDKDISADDVESFVSWGHEYYNEVIKAAKTKEYLGKLQNKEIKTESKGGTPPSLVRQTRLLVDEHPELFTADIIPEHIVASSRKVKKGKADAEIVASWIFENKDICLARCPDANKRINKIATEYPKEMRKREENKIKKEELIARFGAGGLKVLPLIEPPLSKYRDTDTSKVKRIPPWYYGAWALAVQRLKSWNSWNEKAAQNYKDEMGNLNKEKEKLNSLPFECNDFIDRVLKIYEKKRTQEIKELDVLDEFNSPYLILGREIRGFDIILDSLIKANSFNERIEALNRLQAERKTDIGDINLFRFIAEDENMKHVHDKDTCLKASIAYKNYNRIRDRLSRLQDHASFTKNDPSISPAWMVYENAKGAGKNNQGYSIDIEKKEVSLSLCLFSTDSIKIDRRTFLIRDSQQLKCLQKQDNKLVYIDPGTREIYEDVSIKGSKLQFDRSFISRKKNWRNDPSLKAYLNISIEFEHKNKPQLLEYYQKKKSQNNGYNQKKEIITVLGLFFSNEEIKKVFASQENTNITKPLTDAILDHPIRIMAVDLGLRVLFSYSVFRIQGKECITNGFCFDMRSFDSSNQILQVVHERSGQIRLMGDKPTEFVQKKRKELEDKMEDIRYRIDAIAYFRRLSSRKSPERKEACEKLISRYENSRKGWPYGSINAEELKGLAGKFYSSSDNEWTTFIDSTAGMMKSHLADSYDKWVHDIKRPRVFTNDSNGQNIGIAGKSMWNISFLTKEMNVMKKWHTLALKSKERSGLEKGEVFARDLREKIENLKEDRLKESSDALIMTALGYVWVAGKSENRMVKVTDGPAVRFVSEDEFLANRSKYTLYSTGKEHYRAKDGFWIKLYEPCDAIVFEELQNYRTDDERPTRENGLLMRWAHRSTIDQVRLQSELPGILIGSVGASYSSRFHAPSGAPGVRANAFRPDQIRSAYDELNGFCSLDTKSRKISSLSSLARTLFDLYGDDVLSCVWSFLDALGNKGENYGILIPQNGGEYFITGYKDEQGQISVKYTNADINAAQNLAKRWITRYDNPSRIKINIQGDGSTEVDDSSVRIKRVIGDSKFTLDDKENIADKWFSGRLESPSSSTKPRKSKAAVEEKEDDEEDSDFSSCNLFQDVSGTFFDKDEWVSSMKFWKTVRQEISELIVRSPLLVKL